MSLQNKDLTKKVAKFIKTNHPKLNFNKCIIRDVRGVDLHGEELRGLLDFTFSSDGNSNEKLNEKYPINGIEFSFSSLYFNYNIDKNTLKVYKNGMLDEPYKTYANVI